MDTKHTPTPWHVETEDGSVGGVFCFDGRMVAQTMQMQPINQDLKQVERRANTAFIVRACNSHDQLKEAVNRLLMCMALAGWENDPTAEFARKSLLLAEN